MHRSQGNTRAVGGYGHYDRLRRERAVKQRSKLRPEMIEGLDYVKGVEKPSGFPNVIRRMIRDGYSNVEIAKVVGRNGLRLPKQVL